MIATLTTALQLLSPTLADMPMFSGGTQTIQIAGFVTLGLGGLWILVIGQKWGRRVVGGVRGLKIEPWHRIRPVADTLQLVVGGLILVIGVLCLWLAGALSAVDAYQHKELIGEVEFSDTTADDKMILIYQQLDADGNKVGKPITTQSHGDSISISYTIVRIKDDFFLAGVKQMYKIDYIGGTYYDRTQLEFGDRPHYELVDGGRLKRYSDMQRNIDNEEELPFPYNFIVSSVSTSDETRRVVYPDGTKRTGKFFLYLSHDTIFFLPRKLREGEDPEDVLEEEGGMSQPVNEG